MRPTTALWTFNYPDPVDSIQRGIALGEIGVFGEPSEIAIITYGNGYFLSLQAAKILRESHDITCRVVDIRWLAPLPIENIMKAVKGAKHILIVDECRRSGSPSEALMTAFGEHSRQSVARYTAEDCFIATGPAYAATLPSRDGIVSAVLNLNQQFASAQRA